MADKLYISKVTLPSGNDYYIKDAEARIAIEALSNATHFIGVSSTEITDGGTEKPTIDDVQVNPEAGDIVIYDSKEFIWNGSAWNEFGDATIHNLGNMAYVNSVSTSYTPEGDVTAEFTGSEATVEISGDVTGDISATFSGSEATITVDGTVASQSIEISGVSGTTTYTPAGAVTGTFTGSEATVEIGYKPQGTVSASFSGSEGDVSVSGTPLGSISIPAVAASLTGNYTPEGSINTPSISVSAPSATVVNVTNISSVAAPTFSASLLSVTVGSSEELILSLVANGFDAGVMPTFSEVTAVTSVDAELAASLAFTGTKVNISAEFNGSDTAFAGKFTPEGDVTGTFSGSSTTLSSTITPEGSISASFSGTGARLVGTFAETNVAATGTYTPEGTVTGTFSSTFSGSSTITPEGTISATFSGSSATITLVAPDPNA